MRRCWIVGTIWFLTKLYCFFWQNLFCCTLRGQLGPGQPDNFLGADSWASDNWALGPNCPGPSCPEPNLPRTCLEIYTDLNGRTQQLNATTLTFQPAPTTPGHANHILCAQITLKIDFMSKCMACKAYKGEKSDEGLWVNPPHLQTKPKKSGNNIFTNKHCPREACIRQN